jgi:hypothetical protein
MGQLVQALIGQEYTLVYMLMLPYPDRYSETHIIRNLDKPFFI